MRRTTAVLIVAAFLTAMLAIDAHARPRDLPDVRQQAAWSAVIEPAWPLAFAADLCRGYRPSDLEAWTLATNVRVGDDLLRYIPSPLPDIVPPVVLSRYPFDVRVWGWCG